MIASMKRTIATLVVIGFPFTAEATIHTGSRFAPPVYSEVDLCSGVLSDTTTDRRLEACSSVIGAGRLAGKSLGAVYEARALIFQLAKQSKRAITDYTAALALNPARSQVLVNRGAAYLDIGDTTHALSDYSAVLRDQPKNFWALYNRGIIYSFYTADQTRALADFDAAIAIDQNYAPVYSARGILFSKLGEPARAITDHNTAIRLKPGFPSNYELRANAYMAEADYSHAIADYSQALALAPNRAAALFGRGLAEVKSGQITKGEAEIAAAKKLKPDIADEFAKNGLVE